MAFDLDSFHQAAGLIERARLIRVQIQTAQDLGVVRVDRNKDLDIPFTSPLENLWTQRAVELMRQAKTILDALV